MLRDITGCAEEAIEVDPGARVDSIFERYAGRFPRFKELRSSIVLASNHQFCDRSEIVCEGDEIAFLPPVSGGSGRYTQQIFDAGPGHFFALTREPIDTAGIAKQLLQGVDGALVNFEGVVRNNTKGRPTEFGRELAAAHAISRIAMVHRLGRMQVGETSVAVIVTAPHRKPAFEAALEGINRLKRTVPIWKKEHFTDGEIWVEGEWDESVLKQ